MGAKSASRVVELIEDGDGVRLRVHVQPRARRNAIVGIQGDALKVTITSPPVGGAANRGLKEFLGKTLGIAPSRIEILSGQTSRHKTLKVMGLTLDRFRTLLSHERF
jgi:hypothetical protein